MRCLLMFARILKNRQKSNNEKVCEILNAHFFDDKGLKNILLHSKLQNKENNVPYEMEYIIFCCRYEINQLYSLEFFE